MKILFYGDVVGKIGRKALQQAVAADRATHQPDLIIANTENAAHGKGITTTTLAEVMASGVDACTSGNHILSKTEGALLLNDAATKVIRPENFAAGSPGRGAMIVQAGKIPVLLINLVGQVFMKDGASYDNPFQAFDRLREQYPVAEYPICFVDFHAEVTSEKVAFGWHAAGRASVVVGTHTHIPTADGRVLPGGTAYVTDVGMTGAGDSVIGMEREPIVAGYIEGRTTPTPAGIPEHGPAVINAVLVTIDDQTGHAQSIVRVDSRLTV
jgi:metallophosphoesterase (TIGR00282 family)